MPQPTNVEVTRYGEYGDLSLSCVLGYFKGYSDVIHLADPGGVPLRSAGTIPINIPR
jgi:hypothetical protein